MIAEITSIRRLEGMLGWLESEGYALWFDEQTKEWSLLHTKDDGDYNSLIKDKYYSVSGLDKEQVILMGFRDLCY